MHTFGCVIKTLNLITFWALAGMSIHCEKLKLLLQDDLCIFMYNNFFLNGKLVFSRLKWFSMCGCSSPATLKGRQYHKHNSLHLWNYDSRIKNYHPQWGYLYKWIPYCIMKSVWSSINDIIFTVLMLKAVAFNNFIEMNRFGL